ncbi:MAG: sulfatase, partial [Opitutae bacterium]|nr:sulfatase [Opitutae bacterium]
MQRRLIISLILLRSSLVLFSEKQSPNILWITAEDMSPVLGCYGEKDAVTPHIDQL